MNMNENMQPAIHQFAMIWNYNAHVEHQNNYFGTQQGVEESEEEGEFVDSCEQRVKAAIEILQKEGELKYLYDYTWVMEVMNQTDDSPSFKTPNSFISYIANLGVERLPSPDTIQTKQSKFSGTFPNWEFIDCDTTEANRRINVARRFLKLYKSN